MSLFDMLMVVGEPKLPIRPATQQGKPKKEVEAEEVREGILAGAGTVQMM